MRKVLLCLVALGAFAPWALASAAQGNLFGAADPYRGCVAAIDVNPADALRARSRMAHARAEARKPTIAPRSL